MGGENSVMLTLRDAARATGLSVKAVRRRVERGSLPHQLIDGQRRVPMSALLAQGLLVSQPVKRDRPVEVTPAAGGRISELETRIAALEARIATLESVESPAAIPLEVPPVADPPAQRING